jgi:hypothetical protein
MKDNLENRLDDLGRTIGIDDTMVPRVMDRMEKALGDQPLETGRIKYESSIRRLVMNRVGRWAVAAVIAIGVIVGYGTFRGTGGVSWAQVLQQVAAVRAVTYTLTATAPGREGLPPGQTQDLRLEGFQSSDRGIRMDAYLNGELVNQSYTLLDEGLFVTLMPGQKLYTEVKLTEALREEVRRSSGDPRVIVDEFLNGPYTELGRSEINGIVVEGVESHDVQLIPAFFTGPIGRLSAPSDMRDDVVVGRLWVDVATDWPVEMTLDITSAGGPEAHVVVTDFQWEAQVAPDTFVPAIPADYRPLAQVDVGQLATGVQIAEALAYFAELSGGTYPTQLTPVDIVSEVGAIYKKLDAAGVTPQIDDDMLIKLKYAATYVRELGDEGKEPAYYGDTVTAADADKVLLRWKLDDTQYRVIFGDLRLEDVGSARLAELEAQ